MFIESTTKVNPCKVFIIGLQPNEQLLGFVESMRRCGYDETSIWNVLAVEWSRIFTKWYGIQSIPKSTQVVPCTTVSITSILLDSLPQGVRLISFVEPLRENNVIFTSAKPWQLIMEFEHIPF